MSEIFRERIEPSQTSETAPQAPLPIPNDEIGDGAVKAQGESISELEIWEGENHRKFGHDYFKIREFAHEFPVKAQFGAIDKFVKEQLEERQYAKTTENYQKILQEIETEIGSTNLDTFSRLKKLFGYVQAITKLYKAKKLKESYLISPMSS